MDSLNQENILKQAGLSEEQAITYEALLDKGPQKASALANWTGIKRGLTYKVLEQLENMGLVEKKGGTGTVAVFYPTHPSMLLDKMERDQKNLNLAREMVSLGLGALSSKYNLILGKPNVRFFEGKDAIEKITGDYPVEEKEIRQLININDALNFMKKETLHYKNERIKNGINKKMLLEENPENIAYAKNPSSLTEFKTIKTKIPTAIQIYDNKVSMLNINPEKQIGFIIEDKMTADTMKNIFDALWNSAKTIEQENRFED